MTGIDGYDWASVGWSNPVPGDADVVRQIGGQMSDLASEASLQNQLLQSVGDDTGSIWSGPAANTFHPTIKKLPGQIDQLINSYNDAAYAISGFWPKQQAAQQLAVRALAKAQAAQAAISAAQAQVSSTQSASQSAASAYNQSVNPPPGTPPPATAAAKAANLTRTTNLAMAYRTAQTQLGNAQSALTAARGDMAAAVSMRDQAASDFSSAAGAFVGLIREASKAGIQNVHHGWLSSLGSAIAGGVESAFHAGEQLYHEAVHLTDAGIDQLGSIAVAVGNYEYHQIDADWHDFTQAMTTALPVLKVIDTVLSDASLVVGVLALVVAPIPGLDIVLDPALEGLNEVLLVAKTGDDLLELAGGDAEAESELIGDGIGMATMGIANGLATEGAGDVEKAGEEVEQTVAGDTSEAAARGSSEATATADTAPAGVTGGATTTADSGASAEGAEAAGAGSPAGTGPSDDDVPEAAGGGAATGGGDGTDEAAATPGVATTDEATAATDGAGSTSEPSASASEPSASASEPSASASEPSASEPSAPEPSASEPSASDPAASGSSSPEPSAGEPAASEPSASGPSATEPSAGQPSATEPSGSGPSASEPSVSGPSATEPATSGAPAGASEAPAASSDAPAASSDAPAASSDAPAASSDAPATNGASSPHEPSTSGGSSPEPATNGASPHEPSTRGPDGDPNASAGKESTLAKIVGKEKLQRMTDVKGMKANLTTAKDTIQRVGLKDLPKSYAGWVKQAYHIEVGERVGADGKVISSTTDGLNPLRKVLYIRDRVETGNDVFNFGDKLATGHGNFLQRQDNGKDWESQAWDKTAGGDDDPPIWVSGPLDGIGVG